MMGMISQNEKLTKMSLEVYKKKKKNEKEQEQGLETVYVISAARRALKLVARAFL
jgi:hypothetical protein